MPLIRYQTGDWASPKKGLCPCGRNLSLMHLSIGREVDMVRLADGRVLHPEIFTPPSDTSFPVLSHSVKQFRVIQETFKRFLIEVVAARSQELLIREQFTRMVEEYLGKGFDIDVKFVFEIPREPSGKLRYFVSKLREVPS